MAINVRTATFFPVHRLSCFLKLNEVVHKYA